jgi:serine/threonine protein kinase
MSELALGEKRYGRGGTYRIGNLLNDGAQAVLYAAWEERNGERCVVKVFRRPWTHEEDFRMEHLVGLMLPNHDEHLVGPGDIVDSLPATVSPLVENAETLAEFLEKDHEFRDELKILAQIVVLCSKLDALGIEHGDLSWDNILIKRHHGPTVFLVDLESYNTDDPRIAPSNISGTPPHIDPAREYDKDFGIGGDVFSLCLVAVAMLTGQSLLPTDSMEEYLDAIERIDSPHDLLSKYREFTAGQINLLSRGLSRKRLNRPRMAELAKEFGNILNTYHVCIHCNKVFYLDKSRGICPFCNRPNRLAVHLDGQVFDLRLSQISIGRSGDNDIPLKYVPDGDTVSGQHALVIRWGTKYSIADLGSTNGTFVNGVQLTPRVPHPLKPGDIVRLGGVEVRVAILGS